jgi:hypothetical protein
LPYSAIFAPHEQWSHTKPQISKNGLFGLFFQAFSEYVQNRFSPAKGRILIDACIVFPRPIMFALSLNNLVNFGKLGVACRCKRSSSVEC